MNTAPFRVFIEYGRVKFTVGVQTFTMGYDPDDEDEKTKEEQLEWYSRMLTNALGSLFDDALGRAVSVFMPECDRHTGDNTPSFREFTELYANRCHVCDAQLIELLSVASSNAQVALLECERQLEAAKAYAQHERDLGAEPFVVENASLRQGLADLKGTGEILSDEEKRTIEDTFK